MTELVTYAVEGRVGIITLNRPEARNAVNPSVAAELEAAVDRLESDDDTWVGILAANTAGQQRPVFCAGADLKVIADTGDASVLDTQRGGFAGFVYRDRIKPIIGAVDGLATAGGLEILLATDLIVATTRSSFGLAEVTRNLVPGAGGMFRLPWAVGQAAAMQAILTGEPIDAQRAYELGLIAQLVDPGEASQSALLIAEQIAAAAPLAVRAARRVVRAAAWETEDELKAMSNRALSAMLDSDDSREGVTAFAEKRAPIWRGR